jgi:hypothetical protein
VRSVRSLCYPLQSLFPLQYFFFVGLREHVCSVSVSLPHRSPVFVIESLLLSGRVYSCVLHQHVFLSHSDGGSQIDGTLEQAASSRAVGL